MRAWTHVGRCHFVCAHTIFVVLVWVCEEVFSYVPWATSLSVVYVEVPRPYVFVYVFVCFSEYLFGFAVVLPRMLRVCYGGECAMVLCGEYEVVTCFGCPVVVVEASFKALRCH